MLTDHPTATGPTRETGRLFFLDRVRVLLTALVVLHHVALTYGSFALWYYHEPTMGRPPARAGEWGRLLDLYLLLNQTFAMGLFFLISAHFLPASHDRGGGRRFLLDRLRRLGIPLLGVVLVVVPLAKLPMYHWENARRPISFPDFYLRELEQGPAWFLALLLVFVTAYTVIRAPRPGARPPRRTGFPRARAVAGFALLLAVLGAAWRIRPPVDRVPLLHLPVPAYLPQYVCMFLAGLAAHRRGWLTAIPARASRWGFAAAVAASVTLLPLAVGDPDASGPRLLIAHVAHGLFDGVYCVGMSLGVLGLFARRFTGAPGPVGRFLSGNAYAVYVVHPIVLVAVSVALAGVPAAPLAKFALAAPLSLLLSWPAAAALRTLPYAKSVL
ncbi:acyltransferase family protein [Bailinhaonella thermotolerans]|uniref:Acyltransferase n=1 Tax=Bailinhaonella thermotolerans TaxID=1070861 RepID=A0A3A4B9N6_9ACTN|nr:acyltransferase family protein [Bailinhaonella thermotolerans]RJL35599.1 acyltransferase [Bailinhaonella thermotolerans]